MTDRFFKAKKKPTDAYLRINWEEMLHYVKETTNFVDPTIEISLICKIVQARSLDNAYE